MRINNKNKITERKLNEWMEEEEEEGEQEDE